MNPPELDNHTPQVKLAMCAGALATSDDGAWVCLTNKELGFRDGMKEDVDVDSQKWIR